MLDRTLRTFNAGSAVIGALGQPLGGTPASRIPPAGEDLEFIENTGIGERYPRQVLGACRQSTPGYATSDPYRIGGQPLVTCTRHRNTAPSVAAGHHDWTEYSPSQEIYEAWPALPLIVLAGLRQPPGVVNFPGLTALSTIGRPRLWAWKTRHT